MGLVGKRPVQGLGLWGVGECQLGCKLVGVLEPRGRVCLLSLCPTGPLPAAFSDMELPTGRGYRGRLGLPKSCLEGQGHDIPRRFLSLPSPLHGPPTPPTRQLPIPSHNPLSTQGSVCLDDPTHSEPAHPSRTPTHPGSTPLFRIPFLPRSAPLFRNPTHLGLYSCPEPPSFLDLTPLHPGPPSFLGLQ